jgi:hypothetical protein
MRLRPHGEPGGNEFLSLTHEMDVIDKHRLLVPTDDHILLTSDEVQRIAPDFPFEIKKGASFSNCTFDWFFNSRTEPSQFGEVKPPTLNIFERELDIPIEVVFRVGSLANVRPVIPTLNKMIDAAREAISLIREAGRSY